MHNALPSQTKKRCTGVKVDRGSGICRKFAGKTRFQAPELQDAGAERQLLKRHSRAKTIVTDKLRSCGAAMRDLGNAERQQTGRYLNNRIENSHLPFRRRERAMTRFRRMRSLQAFAAVHASIHKHFNRERHLYGRNSFKLNRAAALAEWQQLFAA